MEKSPYEEQEESDAQDTFDAQNTNSMREQPEEQFDELQEEQYQESYGVNEDHNEIAEEDEDLEQDNQQGKLILALLSFNINLEYDGIQLTASPENESQENVSPRRSRDDRRKKQVFYSDLNEYLYQDPNQDKLPTEETPDRYTHTDQFEEDVPYALDRNKDRYENQALSSYDKSPEEFKYKASQARAYYENQEIGIKKSFDSKQDSEKKVSFTDHQSSVSFANRLSAEKNMTQESKDFNDSDHKKPQSIREAMLQRSPDDYDNMRNYYTASPEYVKAGSVNQPNIDYPSFGQKTESSKETSKIIQESPKSQAEFQDELSTFMNFLVTKYEEQHNKSEAESLILELNRISKSRDYIIPDSFKHKIEDFSRR